MSIHEYIHNDPDLKDDPDILKKINDYGKMRVVKHGSTIVVYHAINFWESHINLLKKYKGTVFEKEVRKQLKD